MRRVALLVLVVALAACGAPPAPPVNPPIEPDGQRRTLVVLGDVLSLRANNEVIETETWPHHVLRDALDRATSLTVLAASGATTADVAGTQVPLAVRVLQAADPSAIRIAVVFSGVAGTADVRAPLTTIVQRLQAAGAKVVLVEPPPAELFVRYAPLAADVSRLDDAVKAVAAATGAAPVDLAPLAIGGTLVGTDGALTTEGHARIAQVVGPVVAAQRP